jgi:hypothetical protein
LKYLLLNFNKNITSADKIFSRMRNNKGLKCGNVTTVWENKRWNLPGAVASMNDEDSCESLLLLGQLFSLLLDIFRQTTLKLVF